MAPLERTISREMILVRRMPAIGVHADLTNSWREDHYWLELGRDRLGFANSSASVNRFEDGDDFLRSVDRPRGGKGPVVEHAVGGDALQGFVLDAHVAQAPRQAKVCDETGQHLGRPVG